MARRIYITDRIDANTAAAAAANNCPEIVLGVPPALQVILAGVMLPYVYEEPAEIPGAPDPVDLRSPDGTRWKLTADNSGILTTDRGS